MKFIKRNENEGTGKAFLLWTFYVKKIFFSKKLFCESMILKFCERKLELLLLTFQKLILLMDYLQ